MCTITPSTTLTDETLETYRSGTIPPTLPTTVTTGRCPLGRSSRLGEGPFRGRPDCQLISRGKKKISFIELGEIINRS